MRLIGFLCCLIAPSIFASSDHLDLRFKALQKAYPEIKAIQSKNIVWADGTLMPLNQPMHPNLPHQIFSNPTLLDQLLSPCYVPGKPLVGFKPEDDPGRIRYEPFFRKIYGNSAENVEKNLVIIDWMPKIFGKKFPLKVTRIHHIDQKIRAISQQLEQLVQKNPALKPFLNHPAGTFYWRFIAGTHQLSEHSFGIALDINAAHSNYWQWDLKKGHFKYHNTIPWPIVAVFEKEGFIWGGKWLHYDTMHFEYRPEVICNSRKVTRSY